MLSKKYYFFISFYSGFLINYFLYSLIRIFATKLPFTLFLPLVIILFFSGVAFGLAISRNQILTKKIFKLIGPFFIILLLSIIYNQNVPFVFILPNPAFPNPKPEFYNLHLLLLIISFFLSAGIFVLPGFYFSKVLKQTNDPFVLYVFHLLGFIVGGFLVYHFVLFAGAFITFILGCILLSLLLDKLKLKIAIIFILIIFIILAKTKKDNFYLWKITQYKKLNTFWSGYYKLDFLSFYNDQCLAAVYNDFMIYYVCNNWQLDHLQRRLIFEKVAKGKKNALIIGGSGGTSTMDIWHSSKNIKTIDAVEIDPVVVKQLAPPWYAAQVGIYGVKINFALAKKMLAFYKKSYVKYNNDIFNKNGIKEIAAEGRAFINKTKNKYDLIFYDGLDNKLLTYFTSMISIESYLFTKEAYHRIFNSLLTKDGLLTIDVGGTIKNEIYPFIASFPDEVHYKVFWYIVSDYPMVGLPLFFVVASKSESALNKVYKELLKIQSIKEVKILKKDLPDLALTDDHPFVYTQVGFIFVLFLIFVIPFLAIIFKDIQVLSKSENFLDKKYFLLVGLTYGMVESFLLSKNSKAFFDPAFGSVLLLTSFIAGNILINLFFKKINPKNIFKFSYISVLIIFLILIVQPKDASISLLVFVAGFFSGFFWPLGLSFTAKEDRDLAYSYDYLGAIIGVALIQLIIFSSGYFKSALIIGFLYILLINNLRGIYLYFSLAKLLQNFFTKQLK